MSFKEEFKAHISAGYPLLYVKTYEEKRAQITIREVAKSIPKQCFFWTVTVGLCEVELKAEGTGEPIPETISPDDLVRHLAESFKEDLAIVVLFDYHEFLNDPVIKRRIRDLEGKFKEKGNNLVFLSPILKIPDELQKDMTYLEFELPNQKELEKVVKEISKDNDVKIGKDKVEAIVDSIKGLTTMETENAVSLSIYKHNGIIPNELRKSKVQIIKKSGILEYREADTNMNDVGGFGKLKEWLQFRKRAFTKEAREYGIVPPKGALLLGLPGCGKSLVAKSISSEWGYPLLILDIGKIFGSLVGQSEENTRQALQLAEAVAPCIMMVDEIEKGLAGSASGGKHDSGVTSRVFGTILNWMQERQADVFVVATANQIKMLPPEFLRKGRFDEIFFVDLPFPNEREEIFKIHLKKRKRKPNSFNIDELVEATEKFTGSEIEEAINSALFYSFEKKRELKTEDILRAVESTTPLSKTMAEDLNILRDWARDRAVNVSGKRIKKIKKLSGKRRIQRSKDEDSFNLN